MSRDPNKLTAEMYNNWFLLRRLVEDELGFKIGLSYTSRTLDEQRALYAQGREVLFKVNRLREKAVMSRIHWKQNRYTVTKTLDSKHVISDDRPLSEAFDIYIKRDINGDGIKEADYSNIDEYKKIAEIGRRLGMKAGSDWGDHCHFEAKNE